MNNFNKQNVHDQHESPNTSNISYVASSVDKDYLPQYRKDVTNVSMTNIDSNKISIESEINYQKIATSDTLELDISNLDYKTHRFPYTSFTGGNNVSDSTTKQANLKWSITLPTYIKASEIYLAVPCTLNTVLGYGQIRSCVQPIQTLLRFLIQELVVSVGANQLQLRPYGDEDTHNFNVNLFFSRIYNITRNATPAQLANDYPALGLMYQNTFVSCDDDIYEGMNARYPWFQNTASPIEPTLMMPSPRWTSDKPALDYEKFWSTIRQSTDTSEGLDQPKIVYIPLYMIFPFFDTECLLPPDFPINVHFTRRWNTTDPNQGNIDYNDKALGGVLAPTGLNVDGDKLCSLNPGFRPDYPTPLTNDLQYKQRIDIQMKSITWNEQQINELNNYCAAGIKWAGRFADIYQINYLNDPRVQIYSKPTTRYDFDTFLFVNIRMKNEILPNKIWFIPRVPQEYTVNRFPRFFSHPYMEPGNQGINIRGYANQNEMYPYVITDCDIYEGDNIDGLAIYQYHTPLLKDAPQGSGYKMAKMEPIDTTSAQILLDTLDTTTEYINSDGNCFKTKPFCFDLTKNRYLYNKQANNITLKLRYQVMETLISPYITTNPNVSTIAPFINNDYLTLLFDYDGEYLIKNNNVFISRQPNKIE
jgi:hypothetical protein